MTDVNRRATNRYSIVLSILFLFVWIGSRIAYAPVQIEERPTLTFTNWTDERELFFEMKALVRGRESLCVAFVTKLRPFSALAQGRVTLMLRSISGEERFESLSPSVPGIFHLTAKPVLSGRRRLLIQISAGAVSETHDLGYVTVFKSLTALRRANLKASSPTKLIQFLKDQQWATDFGAAVVAEHPIRPTLRVPGILRARPDGEIIVTAPVAGRFATGGHPLLHLGEVVAENDLLGAIEPSIKASDLAPGKGAKQTHGVQAPVPTAQAGQVRLEPARSEPVENLVLLRAPRAGTVTANHAVRGAFFEAGATLARITDLTEIWLEVRVPAADVAKLSVPRGASFLVEGIETPIDLPAESMIARGQVVDQQTNSRLIVFSVDNRRAGLHIGASCSVFLVLGEARSAVAIPESSIIEDGGISIAYVQVKGESFERRALRLGIHDRGFVEVLEGVKPGEHVVTRGASSIKRSAARGGIPSLSIDLNQGGRRG